jgi:hypothetical protein
MQKVLNEIAEKLSTSAFNLTKLGRNLLVVFVLVSRDHTARSDLTAWTRPILKFSTGRNTDEISRCPSGESSRKMITSSVITLYTM